VHLISNINTADMTYEIDISVFLDWVDNNLKGMACR